MCNRVNLDFFGASTTTTSALPTATRSVATQKIFRSQASTNLLVSVAFIQVVLGGGFVM